MGDIPLEDRPPIEVVGYGTLESSCVPLADDVTELHPVPSLYGGGGAVRIGIGAAFLPFITIWLKPVMIILDISLIAGGIFSSVNNAPKEVESPTYLFAGKNTTAIGPRSRWVAGG